MSKYGQQNVGPAGLRTTWPLGDPGAGFEVFQVVPAGYRWKLRGLALRFTADATVINRTPSLKISDAAFNTIFYFAANLVFAALSINQMQFYHYGFLPAAQAFGGVMYNYFELPNIILEAGTRIETITTNIQAGDNYTLSGVSGGMDVEEYLVNTP